MPQDFDLADFIAKNTDYNTIYDQWKIPGQIYHDPVEELYKYEQNHIEGLWRWIIGSMIVTLICMAFTILVGLGKVFKWNPSHGEDLFKVLQNSSRYIFTQFRIKCSALTTSRNKPDLIIEKTYEKAVDLQLEEIHVYEKGRRVSTTPRLLQKKENNSKHILEAEHNGEVERHSLRRPKITSKFKRTDSGRRSLSFLKRFSLRRSHFTRTIPYKGSKDRNKRLKVIEQLRGRPLPPLPTLRDIMKERNETFHHSHLFHGMESKKRNTEKKILDFETVQMKLLTPSQEQLYLIDYRSERKNTVADFRKHRAVLNQERDALRSMSLDDDYLKVRQKVKKTLLRRSRSLDILEENITVNKLYAEIRNPLSTSSPSICEIDGYLKLNENKDEEKQRNVTETYHIPAQRSDSLYAKIPELPLTNRVEIQNRPIPVPYELQRPRPGSRLSDVSQDHIYQRASLIQAEKNSFYVKVRGGGRELSDQFSSFRSVISLNSSGNYARIPQVINEYIKPET